MLSFLNISLFFCTNVFAEELIARKPLPKHTLRIPDTIDSPAFDYRLTVKFRDDWQVRAAADGGLTSKTHRSISDTLNVSKQYNLTFKRLISLPEETIVRIENRARSFSGTAQPDLMGMMVVNIPPKYHADMINIGEQLQHHPEVEYAYIETIGTPPPGDIGTTTPDYSSMQGYGASDPGINIDYMHSLGITGTNVQVTDCEYGYNDTHEDLMDQDITMEANKTIPSWVAGYGWDDHGTAVVGEIIAGNNGYGVTGLMYDTILNFNPEWTNEDGGRRVDSIASAIDTSGEGDIILLEMQTQASYISGTYLYGPAELDPNVWTVTRAGTDAGVIIVAAGGNGDQNLDSSAYATYASYGDSGAIVVGASSADANHDKLSFSTYGSRINVNAWGEAIFSTGYGYYSQIDGDSNQEYTEQFGGTSGASPIITSACIALQDYVLSNGNDPLTPSDMRQLLMDTGMPQGAGGAIGVYPDMENAMAVLDTDMDGWIDPQYGGMDCDDADSMTYPGATEVWYDDVDQNCDGANDYDQDGDGFTSSSFGGTDCDDTDSMTYPGALDGWYDGIDSNCDGADDYDQDGDGFASVNYGGTDCEDMDTALNPTATEIWYDGIDQNCDGANDYDQDGDGYGLALSCITFDLTDSYGDGWNANLIEVYEGSTLMETITIFNGYSNSVQYCPSLLASSVDYVFSEGNWVEEISFTAHYTDSSGSMVTVMTGTGMSSGLDVNGTVYSDGSTIYSQIIVEDCDDTDASIYTGATDAWYDGIDSNCDGADDYDQDGDGFILGDDCDDTSPSANPDAADAWYDGIDSNCDGADDYDQDGDGFVLADDCNDIDVDINPGATDTWYDGVDSDCDGANDYDQDGDGYLAESVGGADCDDTDSAISPDATDTWYDGIDSNCDGADDYDQDGDGFTSVDHGGTDCDDLSSSANTAATDTWYDGIDSNCDGADDYDQDGDGFALDNDCNDLDAAINSDAEDTWYDGIDSNCDGADDYDQDGDGFNSSEFGGADCDDDNADINPSASEIEDGLDNDCDGKDETADADEDGLTDLEEAELGTNPASADSDGDGVSDGDEQAAGTDPLAAEVEEEEVEEVEEDDDAKGGCSSTGTATDQLGLLALLSLVGFRRRRTRLK